jgi:NSS family neurotransmitter:Na+ symporter
MAQRDQWGTRIGLVLAMAGNAVGLGNFLRFPVQAVQNGGGAFIIPYLVCFLLMGIPLLWIEWSIGRFGGRSGNHSTPFIMDSMDKRRFWKYIGVFGIFTNIGVAAYYCYIESWTMSYVFHSIIQTFTGMSQEEVAAFFVKYVDIGQSTTGIPFEAVIFYLLCLGLNTYILSRGLSGGVEKVAKIGMPLLILFGILLAVRGVTLGNTGLCADCDSRVGMNFLWEPQFDKLMDLKVWFAAAGQIFFTLSLGMGTIQCYASYVRSKDDIALNAMSAGWMNGFVEIVLGASIVIPISVGYLGLDWVKENAGFSMAFQTMPYLFNQWGAFPGSFAGVMWFGLLFFAGITSSLAMGTPWMGFMQDEYKWSRPKSAFTFGLLVLIMGLPTVFFFQEGFFDEYDYWAGTASLVIFATFETILFAWIFGINKGWNELIQGADMKVPAFFKYIMVFVTPLFLIIILLGTLITPKNGDWEKALTEKYELDHGSLIGKLTHSNIVANRSWFSDRFESEVSGIVTEAYSDQTSHYVVISDETGQVIKTYSQPLVKELAVSAGDKVEIATPLFRGRFVNPIFYLDLSRIMLLALFIFISMLVYKAYQKRQKLKRIPL